jgi:SAM-dependent MidA family methyltransferase
MFFLSTPPIEAQAHSAHLTQVIQTYIQQKGGWISFAEFMQKALYEPGLGYYVAGARKFGAEGDFVTAPEISPAFSQCLARQCQQVLDAASSILEFGAGTGVMAADILLALEKQQSLPKHYFILEISPDLQQRQQETLQQKCPHLFERVCWLSALPTEFEGVVLANEVLDAMPVHLFEMHDGEVLEKGVSLNGHDFAWKLERQIDGRGYWQSPSLPPIEGYFSEICFAIHPWLEALYKAMKRGAILLIDYGFLEHEYYHPQRDQGTLMCHYRHRAHTDPFVNIGLQDITAHVDFSAVARAAENAGFIVENYTTQAKFLMSLGILNPLDLPLKEQYQHAQALKKLLLPSEMGELFKVMVLGKGVLNISKGNIK